MRSYKIFSIFFLIVLTQSVLCRPLEDSEEDIDNLIEEIRTNGTVYEKLILQRLGNYMLIPQKYVSNVANATEHMLKDEALVTNNKTEIWAFKNNLTLFLQKYDPSANLEATHETMEIYTNITQHYLDLAPEQETEESKLIVELLNKYVYPEYSTSLDVLEAGIDEWRVTAGPAEKLFIFTLDHLITIPLEYASNATNATQYLLKDETLVANTEPLVLEFKKKLNLFLEEFDSTSSNIKQSYDSMNAFAQIMDTYLPHTAVSEEPARKFIRELLHKYNCQEYSMKFVNFLEMFFENFTKMFEESKENLEKPLLDWFEKFKTLTKFPKKLESINKFVELV